MNESFNRAAAPTFDRTGMNLQAYNHLILQHQDEAFTLAVDLLGDEIRAEEALEKVIAACFTGRKSLPGDFRIEILRQVVRACLRGSRGISGPRSLARYMSSLSEEEKAILVLVDCLGLDYADAAAVLGKPTPYLSKSLAKARYKMNTALMSFGNR